MLWIIGVFVYVIYIRRITKFIYLALPENTTRFTFFAEKTFLLGTLQTFSFLKPHE